MDTDRSVWKEKLLEHYIAYDILRLRDYGAEDCYVDVAAHESPWAKILRENCGVKAFAVDLTRTSLYADLPYHLCENAVSLSFNDASVSGMSLQCAYGMFCGNDDVEFIKEAARNLRPGGKLIIVPLYMHTHYCAYSTPEHFGKGFSGEEAKEYIRIHMRGVTSSRKYDPLRLKKRVLDTGEGAGLEFGVLVLRNATKIDRSIYCHFILEATQIA